LPAGRIRENSAVIGRQWRLTMSTMEERFGADLRVLVVDDDAAILLLLTEFLSSLGFEVAAVATVAEAHERLLDRPFDLYLLDKDLPDGSGLDVARSVRQAESDAALVMITAFANVSSATEAVRLAFSDYLEKPFASLDELRERLRQVVTTLRLQRRNRQLIEALTERNRELAALAVRDPVTKLYNHVFLQESLQKEISRSRRHALSFALLLIDVDRFAQLNSLHGHGTGDKVLRELAELVSRSSRDHDPVFRLQEDDVAARFGGDRFAVLLPNATKQQSTGVAERFRSQVAALKLDALGIPGQTVSIGVSAFPDDGSINEELVNAAEHALTAAKLAGRNCVVAYHPGLTAESSQDNHDRSLRAVALHDTIARRDFAYVYQPIVDAASGRSFAFEALCRPRNPAWPNPSALIAAAETLELMDELGRAMRIECVKPVGQLPAAALLFINLHPHELRDPALLADEPEVIRCAKRIVFEVTETAAIEDFARVREALDRLRSFGFRIALDDLGSCYSGLNALARLEPDFVKLDMELVRGVREDSRTARLVKYIFDFAHGEGMQVVAEGIETEEQRRLVASMGCPLLQGYYFAKGMPVDQASHWEPARSAAPSLH
jgi:diguanylate cyclase (GGDEF)-like protein